MKSLVARQDPRLGDETGELSTKANNTERIQNNESKKRSLRRETKNWNKQKGPFWTWQVHEERSIADFLQSTVHRSEMNGPLLFGLSFGFGFWILVRWVELGWDEEENENKDDAAKPKKKKKRANGTKEVRNN